MSSDWCTIESDPGVFTSLIESFGVKNVELTELWSLDDDSMRMLTNPLDGVEASVHGLIFLFKWQSQSGNAAEGAAAQGNKPLSEEDTPSDLFFARQMTHNACATQAILSVLFNAPNSIESNDGDKVDDNEGRRLVLGDTLSNFKTFTAAFPPDLKGEAIGSSDEIRTAHNSFGSNDAFLSDPTKPKRAATEDDDVFHFVAYVPHGEDVYELDGLQCGPIKVGSYVAEEGKQNWIEVARNAIQNRLESYNPSEIKFNLMAVVQDKRTYLAAHLDKLAAAGVEESSPDMLQIRSSLHEEEEKRARWAVENERRRFNYLPFCVEYLRCLAGSGKLESLIGKAKMVAGEKRKRAEAWKSNGN